MIDLLTENRAWEPRQIAKRAEALLRQQFSVSDELILNRKVKGAMQGVYTLSPDEEARAAAFQAAAFAAQAAARQAEADNAKLKDVLAYEQAQRDLAEHSLRIEGRAEVPAVEEVPEQRDPDTGEVVQEYVPAQPAIPAIEPLPTTIDTVDEQGNPVTADNPSYVQAVAARDAAQAVIDAATQDTLDLLEARRNAT